VAQKSKTTLFLTKKVDLEKKDMFLVTSGKKKITSQKKDMQFHWSDKKWNNLKIL